MLSLASDTRLGLVLKKGLEELQDRKSAWLATKGDMSPPPQLPQKPAAERAEDHMKRALAALHSENPDKVQCYRQLRLLLNRLEQGGIASLRALDEATPLPAPLPRKRRRARLTGAVWATANLAQSRLGRERSRAEA